MIDKPTVQRILDAADIVEVVSDYVNLVRRGSNYMGLCPFHNEKTPSFSVSRSRNICHCFSCGKGGSPVNFIMEKEGVNYHDALLHLANKYGIKVEERQLSDEERQRQSQRESMLLANDWAAKLMEHNLLETDDGKNIGLQYLYQRGVTQEAIKAFRLGYALDVQDNLVNIAKKEGYDIELLKTLGLIGVSQNSGKHYDRFRGRVIFPILNTAGKVIAFGGRGIKGEPAKYINSPESSLYRKSNELYGIYQARNAIVREKRCFLVEGYMDVIGMWQSGMQNVVASSGTSLTDGQIALIHRFTDNVTLIYDGDSAGIKASLRGIDMLLAQKLNVTVLLLPDNDDPDSFARKHTPEEFREYVASHETDFIDFEINVLTAGADTPHARAAAVSAIVKSIASVADPIQRQIYIQTSSQRLNLGEDLLLREVKKARIQVLDEMRKRKNLDRINREEQDKQDSQSVESSPNVQVISEDNSHTNTSASQPRPEKLVSLEHQLLCYMVKYGMVEFCETVDNDGVTQYISVADYIVDEINIDNLSFVDRVSQKVYDEVVSISHGFQKEQSDFLEELSHEEQKKLADWYEEMSSTAASLQEIENKETEYRESLNAEKISRLKAFAMNYTSRILGSHHDDDIRTFALKAITPRYQLSRYHTRNAKIVKDEDRLMELVPRAISEWKDGILANRLEDLRLRLKESTERGDSKAVSECLQSIQETTLMRNQLAKSIGERILSPSRR